MAAQKEIEELLKQLEEAPPSAHFQNIDKNSAGIHAILKYLSEAEEKVTAGKISEHLHVSTARTAVLLRKMEAQNLIERKQDANDRRIVVVKLSAKGRKAAQAAKEDVYKSVGELIDKVGMKKMREFAAISAEIHSIMADVNAHL